MMKRLLFLLCAAICLPAIISCSDTDGLEDHTYDRWQERNDSAFAAVYAQAQHEIAQGSSKWRIFKSYATTLAATPENSIVVRIDRQGTGSGCPLYTDSVRVNYQGLLLTGKQFDHSGLFKDYEHLLAHAVQPCGPAGEKHRRGIHHGPATDAHRRPLARLYPLAAGLWSCGHYGHSRPQHVAVRRGAEAVCPHGQSPARVEVAPALRLSPLARRRQPPLWPGLP